MSRHTIPPVMWRDIAFARVCACWPDFQGKTNPWRWDSPSLRPVLRRSLVPRSTPPTPLTFNERRRPQQRSPALPLRLVSAVRPHGSSASPLATFSEITASKLMLRSCRVAADAAARRADPLCPSVAARLASTARSAGPRKSLYGWQLKLYFYFYSILTTNRFLL